MLGAVRLLYICCASISLRGGCGSRNNSKYPKHLSLLASDCFYLFIDIYLFSWWWLAVVGWGLADGALGVVGRSLVFLHLKLFNVCVCVCVCVCVLVRAKACMFVYMNVCVYVYLKLH